MIGKYAKSGNLDSADKCFTQCLDVDNVVLTAMICGYFWNGEFDKGREVFVEMRDLGFELNEFSLTVVINGLFDVKEGQHIHRISSKMGLLCGGSNSNAVTSMYSRCGSKVGAVKMFDGITDPDIVSWTERIGAAFDGLGAFGLFKSLRRKGLDVNEYTMISVLSAVVREGMLCLGKQIQAICQKERILKVIHSHIIKCGFVLDNYVVSCLRTTYGRCGSSDESRREEGHSLAHKSGFNHDCFVETAVIDLYCKCGSIGDTEKAFRYLSIDNLAVRNLACGMLSENREGKCRKNYSTRPPSSSFLGGMMAIWTGFRQHRDNGVKSIHCYSRLYLAPLWDRSCPPGTPVYCTGLNISHLVVHDSERAMAVAVNFSAQALRQRTCLRAIALDLLPFQRSCELEQKRMKKQPHGIAIKRQEKNKLTNSRGVFSIMSSNNDSDLILGPPSAADTIKHIYMCINEKNLKKLGGYISEDCYIEDCSFFNPFNGKKEVMLFFDLLMRSMGQNVKFIIEHVCEEDDFRAGVNWHLEWKQTQVPFTRGCSFYECSEEGEKLVIKKALIVIESPIKPGGVVLVLLKNVTTIFDEFPDAAEWFLKSPHAILQSLPKIYTIFLAPLINPLVAGYVRLWEFMARLFAFAIKIMIYISKILFR
ncbi:hypothetical protein CRYUN_Cryun19dG0121300 [Craigia yunnanensis]